MYEQTPLFLRNYLGDNVGRSSIDITLWSGKLSLEE